MQEFVERRSRVRIDYSASITVCPQGSASAVKGACVNVSMDGILIETDDILADGVVCGVKIVLQGENSTLAVDIVGNVARSEDGGIAIQFHENLEWWAIFTIYAQYSGNIAKKGCLLCCPGKEHSSVSSDRARRHPNPCQDLAVVAG